MNFDPTILILCVICIFIFWPIFKIIRMFVNSVGTKGLAAVDASVSVNALEYHNELSTRMRKAIKTMEDNGGPINYQSEYDRLIGKL